MLFLIERLTPKELSALMKASGLNQKDAKEWQLLEANGKKLEKAMKSAKLNKPSLIYRALIAQPGHEILYVLARSGERLVQDRIKNYLQKYITVAAEVTDAEVTGAGPESPKFKKLKDDLVNKRLDARPKKVVVPEAVLPPSPPPIVGRNNRGGPARQ